uniref:Uncharacterized protein n=1 Tax=Neogobius melanostomus TaxID=47308 RepID=A0A8C6V2N9_9GOBI
MVLTGVIQNLLYNIRMGSFWLGCTALCFEPTICVCRLTWETCLSHQPLLGQYLHRLQHRNGMVVRSLCGCAVSGQVTSDKMRGK